MSIVGRRRSDPNPNVRGPIEPTKLGKENLKNEDGDSVTALELFSSHYAYGDFLTNLSVKLQESGKRAIIAGGGILSMIHGEPVIDYDLYVNKSYAIEIIKFLISELEDGDLTLEKKFNRPAYDQSFFRKNNILGRLLFKIKGSGIRSILKIDLIIVSDDTDLIKVVSNFDLTFCEVWYDGKEIYANYPDDVLNKKGSLKPDYVESLTSGNMFIIRRMAKYKKRGYAIKISCNNNEIFIKKKEKLKNSDIIDGTNEKRKEEWAVSFIMKNILKYVNFDYVKENIVDFILDKNTKENLTGLFERYPKDENMNISLSTNSVKRADTYPFIGETPHLYSYLCYIFFRGIQFYIYEEADWSYGNERWFDYLREFVDSSYKEYYNNGEKISESFFKSERVLNNLIGEKKSHSIHDDGLYSIKMSRDFVKCTQYAPYIQLDSDTKENIESIENSGNGDIHLIYACPDGHLHASENCGVPTTISKCGYPTPNGGMCQNYVGGLYHMLVPGNYIVRHDGYNLGYIYYGNFPVYTYKMYQQIYKQANDAIRKWNAKFDIQIPDLKKSTTNKDSTIIAKKYKVNQGLQPREDNNDTCFTCGHEFSKNDQGVYNENLEGKDEELYILPCRHLIHRDCLATARGLNNDNFDPENINDEVDVSRRVCPYTTCNRSRFLFGANHTVRAQTLFANKMVRKRSYIKPIRLRSLGSKKEIRARRSKKRSKKPIYSFGPMITYKPKVVPEVLNKTKIPPTIQNKQDVSKVKKFTRGYTTWHKLQEQVDENSKKIGKIVKDNKLVTRTDKNKTPLLSEVTIRRRIDE